MNQTGQTHNQTVPPPRAPQPPAGQPLSGNTNPQPSGATTSPVNQIPLPTDPTNPAPAKTRRNLIWVSVGISVLVIGLAAGYFLRNSGTTHSLPTSSDLQEQISPSITPSTPTQQVEVPTGWQTYTNQDFGYQISFPSYLQPEEEFLFGLDRLGDTHIFLSQQNPSPTQDGSESSIMITMQAEESIGTNLLDFSDTYFSETTETMFIQTTPPQQLSINGYNGLYIDEVVTNADRHPRRIVVIEGPDSLFLLLTISVQGPTNNEVTQTIDQILGTVVFTTTPQSQKWISYSNSQQPLAFAFKHPSDQQIVMVPSAENMSQRNSSSIFVSRSPLFTPSSIPQCSNRTLSDTYCLQANSWPTIQSLDNQPAESFTVMSSDGTSLRVVQLIDNPFSLAINSDTLKQPEPEVTFNRILSSVTFPDLATSDCRQYNKELPLPAELQGASLVLNLEDSSSTIQQPELALVENSPNLDEVFSACTELEAQLTGKITRPEYSPQAPLLSSQPLTIIKSIKQVCWHPHQCQNTDDEHILIVEDVNGNQWWLQTSLTFNRRAAASPEAEYYFQLQKPGQEGLTPFVPDRFFSQEDGLFVY